MNSKRLQAKGPSSDPLDPRPHQQGIEEEKVGGHREAGARGGSEGGK